MSLPSLPAPAKVASLSLSLADTSMASDLGGGGGDEFGGSLFEGMVLFSPSDLIPPELPQEKELEAPAPVQKLSHPSQQLPPPSPPIDSSTASSTYSDSKSQPLDEDLFSDLTLQTPIGPSETIPASSASTLALPSRQISRKKKRAIRIGYGREASDASPVISADNSHHSIEDSTPTVIDDNSRRTSTASSESATPTPRHHQELQDRSEDEDAEASVVASVTAPSDGDGLPPSRRDDSERDAQALPSTAEASEKEDTLGLIEEKLNLIRAQISAKLDRIRETATSMYAERKELERRRRQAGEDVNQAAARHKDLEKQLEEACEAEDFERADRFSESLAATEKDKERLLITLKERELDCDSIDFRMQEVLKLQIEAEEAGLKLLEQFAKDAADQADLIYRNAEELSSKELEEWQSSMELLEMSKLEMDIEAELISVARSALDNSIEDLVKDDRKEVEELMKKRSTLAKELDELQKLVNLKEAEIADNDAQIHEVERKKSEVASKFQETRSSVGMKHDSLKAVMSRIDLEREVLSSKKNEIDKFVSLAAKRGLTLKELARVAFDEARTCQDLVGLRKDLASSILKSREDKVQLVRTEEKFLEEIQMLRQQISNERTTLQEFSSTRASILQQIDSLKQRIAFIDKRGPELEAEKKVAAAARNFKEAGRIAAEAKTLNSEKESLQNKMDKAVMDLENLERDIKGTISKMQENEELILLKEKEAAVAGFKRLQLVAATARADGSAALELGDSEEGEFLLEEAEASIERAKELQETYSLNPEDHGKANVYFFSVALIINFSGQKLAEMAASFRQPSADG